MDREVKPASTIEQRRFGLRRDLNDLVRGVDGKLSGSKIGTYVAQYISAKILLAYVPPVTLPTWDTLAVLFLVLIAPEAYKQLMSMKWGGGISSSGTVTDSSTSTKSRTVTK